MRRRREASVFTPSLGSPSDGRAPDSQESIRKFQAAQTEKAAVELLKAMPIVAVLYLPLYMSQIIFNELTLEGILSVLPHVVIWGYLCWRRQYLKEKMKRHPIVIALVVQSVGHITVVYTMVSTALQFPEGLFQHRMFLTQWMPWFMLSAVNLYVPMTVFVTFVCPLYFVTWLIFHSLVGFLTPQCVLFGTTVSALVIYARYHQTAVVWQEFQAVCVVQRERNESKATQESFRGILSSIFDASCTCNRSGHLREFSPHLQELLGLPSGTPCAEKEIMASERQGPSLNLCSFAASDAEAERLASFLDGACSGQGNQASKMQCSLRRRGASYTQVVDAHLTAIPLQDYRLDAHATDSLFVVLEAQPCLPAACESSAVDPPDQYACRQPAASGTMEDLRSVDLGSLEDSLGYSTSIHQRSVETQTTNTSTVDIGVQTVGSAGKPPLLAAREPSERPPPTVFLDESLRRSQRRVFGGKQRVKIFPDLHATPRDTIQQLLFTYVMDCINPMCSPGCCMYHSLLFYLRSEATSMLRSQPCRTWDAAEKEQCALCFMMQDKEDEPFQCIYCHSASACGRSPSPSADLTTQTEDDAEHIGGELTSESEDNSEQSPQEDKEKT